MYKAEAIDYTPDDRHNVVPWFEIQGYIILQLYQFTVSAMQDKVSPFLVGFF